MNYSGIKQISLGKSTDSRLQTLDIAVVRRETARCFGKNHAGCRRIWAFH